MEPATKQLIKNVYLLHKQNAIYLAFILKRDFKLYLIEEFKKLIKEESSNFNLDWDIKKTLIKINYQIHSEAIKEKLIQFLLIKV